MDKASSPLLSAPMLKRLYDWTLSLAARPRAELWLAVIAFVESSVFLLPADVLFLPMGLARPDRAYRYALIATVASTLGGILAYLIGALAFETIAKPILEFYGGYQSFESLKACDGRETVMLLLVTSGFSHVPPIKVVNILAGVIDVGMLFFIVSAILARGARFFALAWALRRFGKRIKRFIEKRLGLIATGATLVLIAVYFALKAMAGSLGSC